MYPSFSDDPPWPSLQSVPAAAATVFLDADTILRSTRQKGKHGNPLESQIMALIVIN